MPLLQFIKLSPRAITPTRGSKRSAGLDLHSPCDYTIPAKGKTLILTDLAFDIPPGCYGRIAPRSGLAVNKFIDVGAGVIDQDYRGNVGVLLFNFGEKEYRVIQGEKIAQIILEKIFIPKIKERLTLNQTSRADKGFGSTDVPVKKKIRVNEEGVGSPSASKYRKVNETLEVESSNINNCSKLNETTQALQECIIVDETTQTT